MNADAPIIVVADSSPTWLVLLAVVTAFVTFVDIALRLIAPRTKTTADDRALSYIGRALAWLKNLKPAGIVAVVVLSGMLASVVLGLTACGSRPIAETFDNAPLIDCTILDGSKVQIATATIKHVLDEKPGDWKSAGQAAASFGAALGGCALAKLVQSALSMRGSTAEQWSAHDELERFRSTIANGATFRTDTGDI